MANNASVLPIIRKGHPGLEIVASPVPLLPKDNDIKAQDGEEHAQDDGEHEQVQQLHAQLIDQLRDTLLSTGSAVGLAATQINVPYRAIAFRIPVERSDDGKTEVPLTIAFNPVIEPLMDVDDGGSDDESGGSDVNEKKKRKKNIVYGFEACLSLPGLMGRVPRYNHIRYHYTDALTGEHVTREVSGFHSRLIQHECDHLDGITYVQRMDDMTMFGYVEEMKKYKVDMEKDLVDED